MGLLDKSPRYAALSRKEIKLTGRDGETYQVRLINLDDVPLLMSAYEHLSSESKWFRMFGAVPHLTPELARQLCSTDRETSICTVIEGIGANAGEVIGGARVVGVGVGETPEFAVTLRPEVEGLGLARQLLATLIEIAEDVGCAAVVGSILADNHKMTALARRLGFSIKRDPDDLKVYEARLSFKA